MNSVMNATHAINATRAMIDNGRAHQRPSPGDCTDAARASRIVPSVGTIHSRRLSPSSVPLVSSPSIWPGSVARSAAPIDDSGVAPLAAIWQNPGSRQMLGVATIYAFTAVGSKRALAYSTPETFGALYFALLGLLTLAAFGVTKPARLNVIRERPVAALGVGVLMAVMVVTHFLAISMVEAAYMISVKRTSLLFGILYGALLFREAHLGRNLVAGVGGAHPTGELANHGQLSRTGC